MEPADRDRLVADLVAARLNCDAELDWVGAWTAGPNHVIGPGTLAIVMRDHADTPESHVDLGFVLNRERVGGPILWDCAGGYGDSLYLALARAVDTWAMCTVPTVREMFAQDSTHAEHLGHDGTDGIPGWHCIQGPLYWFGSEDGGAAMEQWAQDAPLLPALAEVLREGFDQPLINGIKLLFGGDVAEVRINGVEHPKASAALRGLDWPRLDPPVFVRCYVLALHPGT